MTGMGAFDDKRAERKARRAERRAARRESDALQQAAQSVQSVAQPAAPSGGDVPQATQETSQAAQGASQPSQDASQANGVTSQPAPGNPMDAVRQLTNDVTRQYVTRNGLVSPVTPAQAIGGAGNTAAAATDDMSQAVEAQRAAVARQGAGGTGGVSVPPATVNAGGGGENPFADFVAGLPEEYDIAIQAAQQYVSNPPQVQPSDLGSLVDYLKQFDDRLTGEEREKLKKRERTGRIITAVGDGLAAIADIAGTARHAPFVERKPNSLLYGRMWDDFKRRVEDKDDAWLNLYLNAYGRDTEAARQAALVNARLRGDANSDLVEALKNKGDAARDWMKLLLNLEGDAATRAEIARHNRETEKNQSLKAQGKSGGSGSGDEDDKPPFQPFTKTIIYPDGNRYQFDIGSYEDAIAFVSYLKDAGVIEVNPFERLFTPQGGYGFLSGGADVDTDTLERYGNMALAIINSVGDKKASSRPTVGEDEFRDRYNRSRFRRTNGGGGGGTSSAREELVEMISKAIDEA